MSQQRPTLRESPEPSTLHQLHEVSTSTQIPNIEENKELNDCLVEIESAFKKRLITYAAVDFERGDLKTSLFNLIPNITNKLVDVLKKFTSVKFNLFVECELENVKQQKTLHNFKSRNEPLFRTSNLNKIIVTHVNKLLKEYEESAVKGSGWFYRKVHKFEVRISQNMPLYARSYMLLPKQFAHCKSLINIKNLDDYCFKYCVLSKFVNENKDLWISYLNRPDLDKKYDWSDINFPTALTDISKFEKRNNISINVFGIEKKIETSNGQSCMVHQVFPLKVSDKQLEDHRDLLLVTDNNNSHYVVISNFDQFARPYVTANNVAVRVCRRCFAHFTSYRNKSADDKLREHMEICENFKAVRCELPKKEYICFNNFEFSQKIRFVIYADFECILQPIAHCQNDPLKSWTTKYQHHKPFSFCYLLKDSMDEHTQLRLFRGKNAAMEFMSSLLQDVKTIDKCLNAAIKPMMPLSEQEQQNYNQAQICHICKKGDFTENRFKVRDHCHVSGMFRGAAHSDCNLKYQNQSFIPVVLHNLSNYDSHFIVRELGFDEHKIHVICNTEEKYISFSKFVPSQFVKKQRMELRFVDSFRFMSSSLQKLASNLPEHKFYETKKEFGSKFNLMCKKGVFPYDYITSYNILLQNELPLKHDFFNRLNNEHISDEDYEHACAVWKEFNIQSLGEYSDLYLKSDTLILADVFENFRDMCLNTYDLDCLYYRTAPGFAYAAMLKYTQVKLPLLLDIDMIMTVERGIRGGICQCVTRHAVANNKFCKSYDNTKQNSFLYYVDANNLYGYAMSQCLPINNFKWLNDEEIKSLDIMSVPDDFEKGYILEVDLDYPDELHDLHKDLPFCAEMKCPSGSKVKKLLTTFEPKFNYVVHYRVLKQAMANGLRLKKIHKVISFDQRPWLKPYIELNSTKRLEANNEFEKDFFKLMNNAVFGKTMENVRKRVDFRLVSNEKTAIKLIAKSNFLDRIIYNQRLVGIHLAKSILVFDKATYVGMCILELSKTCMYDFHYNVMKNHYKDNLKLCYMDTDSFIYNVMTQDLYADMKEHQNYLDTSSYHPDHPLYSSQNKGIIGKFKDECSSEIIEEFVGLRAKCYAIKMSNQCVKKLKGIKKRVIQQDISFDDYVNCLKQGNHTYNVNKCIRSYKHKVYSICMNKVSLSAQDDKRVVMTDGVNTAPYGYHRLLLNESPDEDEPPPKKIKM